ncbi:MAG: hypothetical protein MUO26_10195 [Methanotrichaceae archaeon]|nr:hypothetical protein [Methanotrichaceae archaeon]
MPRLSKKFESMTTSITLERRWENLMREMGIPHKNLLVINEIGKDAIDSSYTPAASPWQKLHLISDSL